MPDLLDIQEKLQDTNAAIARAQRTIAQAPELPSLAANLRSLEKRREDLEKAFRKEAHRLELDICHYRLLFDNRATVSGLTNVLADFQNLFSLVYDALKNGRKLRARIGPDVINETALGFAYSYPGSVGVVMTLSNERLLVGGTKLDEAMETTLRLIKTADKGALTDVAKILGPPSIHAAYKWADDQLRYNVASSVEWRREERVRSSLLVQRPELERFRELASATSEEETEELTVDGELVGTDERTHTFHIELPNGQAIRGKCAPEVISAARPVQLPQYYKVTLIHTTRFRYSTEEPEESWFLTRLEKR